MECLKLTCSGLTGKAIGDRLGISYKTVQKHVTEAYKAIGVYFNVQAAHYCLANDLIGNIYQTNSYRNEQNKILNCGFSPLSNFNSPETCTKHFPK